LVFAVVFGFCLRKSSYKSSFSRAHARDVDQYLKYLKNLRGKIADPGNPLVAIILAIQRSE